MFLYNLVIYNVTYLYKNQDDVLLRVFLCISIFVDKYDKVAIISFVSGAELCNGSTADSDSVCEGSNPSSATIADGP